MSFRQLFFIENKLLGEAPRGLTRWADTYAEPTSDLYFCLHCGDVFARLPVLRADGSTTKWQSYRGVCRSCGVKHGTPYSSFPGSIWRCWDAAFLAALPVPVLQWEFLRHIDNLERNPNGYQ